MAQNLWSGIPAPQSPDYGDAFVQGRERVFGEQRRARADQRDKIALIGQYAVSADTPEKWAAAMSDLQRAGVPDAGEYANRFDLRDQLIERSYATADQMNSRTAGAFLSSLGTPQGVPQAAPQPQGTTLSTGFLSSLGAAPPVGGGIPSRPDAQPFAPQPSAPMQVPVTASAPQAAPPPAAQPAPRAPFIAPQASAPSPQPMGYDGLDSRLPGLAPMAGVSATNTLPGGAGVDMLRPQLARSESGGRSNIVNAQGYSGTYQMGEGALADAGVYRDATPGVQNDWNGQFNIPGFPEVRTQADFLQNPAAQEAAFGEHLQRLERDMKGAGLDQYIGQEVGGVPITAEGLVWMAHLGGVNGARRFLETGGRYDPADANGTRLSDYARRGAGEGRGGQVRSATRDVQAPVPNGVPMASLQILARNPTYASTAIESAMGQYAPRKPTEGVVINGRLVNPVTGATMGDYRTNEGMVIDLTPDQAQSLGFPAGTVVQRKADNTLEVVQKAPDKSGGPFEGTSMDAQDSNILLRGDPASTEYAMAWQRQYMTPKIVQIPDPNNPGAMMSATVMVTPPPQLRPPAGMPQQPAPQPQQQLPAPQGAAQPQQTPQAARPAGSVTMQPIPGTTKPLVPTEQQRLDASFADRMAASDAILGQTGAQGADLGQRTAAGLPLGNYLVSPEYQQFDQARRDFVNAQLRRESGAAISQTEFDNAEKQYFPQPGDKPPAIEQKRQARQRAVENMRAQSGPAYRQQNPEAAPAAPSSPASAPAAAQGAGGGLPDGTIIRGPNNERKIKQNGVWMPYGE